MILPIILSGGFGTRLWPLSHKSRPKQFLQLLNEESLFQQTLQRVAGIPNALNPLLVCNEEHRFLVAAQLQALDVLCSGIILEPVGRNTAPAITIAAIKAMSVGNDPVMLILPSDHLITNQAAFYAAVNEALEYAQNGKLVTFGIVPHSPETGYGYIQAGMQVAAKEIYTVKQFVEKPDLHTAKQYLQAGNYYWNGGIFMFRASQLLREMCKYASDILQSCQIAFQQRQVTPDFIRLDTEAFAACRSESIDYAVMEKTTAAMVVPLNAGWSDVGSWSALYDVSKKDEQRNVIFGEVILDDVQDSYLRSEDRSVAAIGVNNVVIVATKDAVLVTNKDAAQRVKNLGASK